MTRGLERRSGGRRALPGVADLRATLRLAGPIVLVQVGLQAMGVVDTIMVGHLSPAALAAVALGNVYFTGPTMFGQGVLMALDPIVSQAAGARDHEAIARALQRGVLAALLLTLATAATFLPAAPVLAALRQPRDVVPTSAAYVLVCIPGVLPFFGFVVLRQTLQAMRRTAAIVVAIVAANLVNAGLNWLLIFGNLGAPRLGPVGSAWASTSARWLMFLILLALGWRELRPHLLPIRRGVHWLAGLWRLLRIGLPIGTTMLLEYGAFAAVALLMGLLGTVPMAGHQIALNLASLTFMVPLGVAGAGAVLVGHGIGRGDSMAARRAAGAALACGAAFMSLSAILFLAAPGFLASLYTDQPAVLALATSLIPIAGVFQVFDGLQVVGAGVLRGVGDTRAPLVVNILGFWMLGLPVSIGLGFGTSAGPIGLWWGLVVGLAAVAFFLLLRIRRRLAGELRRMHVEAHPA
jgi:multidrug resistance protein, MATE family